MLWCGLGCTRRRLEQRVMETGSFFSGGNLNSTHHERIWCGNCISQSGKVDLLYKDGEFHRKM